MILAVCPNPSIDILAEIDHFRLKSVNRFKKELHYPGGKGVHVAMAVAEITGRADLLGVWGGPSGTWIKEECQTRNVTCYGPVVSGWTRSCYTFKSEDPRINETEITGAGPHVSEREYRSFVDEYNDSIDRYEVVCMSGSVPPGFPSETYFHLLGSSNHKKTIIDCAGISLEKALQRNPYCVHINIHEGKTLFDIDDPAQIAVKLKEHCAYAAVTNGADGLYLAHQDQLIHAAVRVDKVISAVGSGDCLTAGLAVAISQQYSIEEMARLAVACGAANCIYEELGMLRVADVQALNKKAQVKTIR
ncbi:MAG TPA: PfkB family carbohydrate kinase [Flavitalea sp.]|nr:PfkB family carbohydrate kinase [Flavitalea sp.]